MFPFTFYIFTNKCETVSLRNTVTYLTFSFVVGGAGNGLARVHSVLYRVNTKVAAKLELVKPIIEFCRQLLSEPIRLLKQQYPYKNEEGG